MTSCLPNTMSKYNPTFTQSVIDATGPKASPRVRQLTTSLIQHLHDFARENELTVDEWMMGVELVPSPFPACSARAKTRR
jgi:catechol 1,2-dioxygenase